MQLDNLEHLTKGFHFRFPDLGLQAYLLDWLAVDNEQAGSVCTQIRGVIRGQIRFPALQSRLRTPWPPHQSPLTPLLLLNSAHKLFHHIPPRMGATRTNSQREVYLLRSHSKRIKHRIRGGVGDVPVCIGKAEDVRDVFWEFGAETIKEGVILELDADVGYVDEAVDEVYELASVIEDEPGS